MDIYEFYDRYPSEINEIYSVIASEYPHASLSLCIKMLFYNCLDPKQGCFDWGLFLGELTDEKIEFALYFYNSVLSNYLSFGLLYLSLTEFTQLIAHDNPSIEDRYNNSDVQDQLSINS